MSLAPTAHYADSRRYALPLCAGILLGWLAAVSAHLVAHQIAGGCVELTLPLYTAPAIERPVMPGT